MTGSLDWLRARLPDELRRRLNRTWLMIKAGGPHPELPMPWDSRPWHVKFLGVMYRTTAPVYHRLLMTTSRTAVKHFYPELRGTELVMTALVFAGLRFHGFALSEVWRHAHRIRSWRTPMPAARPLKILHVTSSFDIGGTQTQIKNLCTAEGTRYRHRTSEVFPELNFLYRRGISLPPARYLRGGVLGRALGRCVLPLATRSSQLIQAYKIACDLREDRPDVIVGWGHEMCATSFVAAALARTPHIVFCIRTFNPAFGWTDAVMGHRLGEAHRRMTPFVSAVIANSTPLQRDHAAWVGIDPARIDVCANGIAVPQLTEAEIEVKRRALRQQLGIDAAARVVINVGRFSAEKGQQSIVTINERLHRDYGSRLVWLLCGDGPLLEPLQRRVNDGGMTNIRLVGRTTSVIDYLCASDVFVMPSDFEGMPNAMMEAMACGLPSVSTDRSGAVDVARHGLEALFYKVGDLQAMEQHVRHLVDNPVEAVAMGRRARTRLAEFSVERSVRRFEEILSAAESRRA